MKSTLTIIFSFLILFSFGQNKEEYKKLADSLIKEGQTEYLIKYFEKELKKHPKNENILRWLGYSHILKNNLENGDNYYSKALVINPKCANCYFHLGRIYAMKNEINKALELVNKSISLNSENADFYLFRAKLYDTMGEEMDAIYDFDKAIKLEPENAEYYIERGTFYTNKQNFYHALADMNKAVKLAPNHYYPYFQRSSAYFYLQKLDKALIDINKSIQLDSTQHLSYTGRAAIYGANKEYKKAIVDNTKAIELKPDEYLPYFNRALEKHSLEDMEGYCSDLKISYSILKRQDSTNSLLADIKMTMSVYCDTSKASYYYQRGIALYNLKQFDKAIDIYTKGLKLHPNNSMLLSFRGNSYLILTEYIKAIADYHASIRNKDNLRYDVKINRKTTKEETETYINVFLSHTQNSIAESKFALGEYYEALAEINKGFNLIPKNNKYRQEFSIEEFYNTRGNIFLAIGKNQQAINDFDMCIKYNSSFSLAYVNRAIAKMNLKNNTKMVSLSIRGSDNQSFNANWTFPLKKKVKKSNMLIHSALDDCNRAIEIDTSLDFAYYIRGHIKQILRYGDFCLDFIKAKELGYPVEDEILNRCK